VFVNNYFKKKTGFENKDILGKSYNFLTTQNSDKSSLDELYKSLQAGEKACTIIETRKADNMPYSTLIAVKPISSKKKKLLYVITLYLDVTRDENHSVRLSLVSELLDMLPQFMMVDSEDPDDTGCLFRKHH
jgi:PAS domain S-box-containing protein